MPRKKVTESLNEQSEEAFVIKNVSGETSLDQKEEKDAPIKVEEYTQKVYEQAMRTYDYNKKQSSAFLKETGTYNSPTLTELQSLAEGAQDDISKILRINSIINKYTNIDDVIGMVVSALSNNLNEEYRLSYKNVDGRNKNKKATRAKEVIDQFNEEVAIEQIIREQIPRTYMEGTVIMNLRKSSDTWTIDTYPLGVGIISPYKVSNDPVIIVDINELKNRLQKTIPKTKKGKSLFFENMDKEIEENFPESISTAYKNKEALAKLDIKYTGVMRVGNHGRKYGVSPLLRALPCGLILDTFLQSDMLNAKARTKKMIAQILDPIILGQDGNRNTLQQQAFAHGEIIQAYQHTPVLYTAPAYVKSISVIEPKGEMVGKDVIEFYLRKQMATLGIGFLSLDSGSGAITSASISLAQLMRTINAIGSELERVIQKFYRAVLDDEGLPPEYAPTIKIIDSEALELELKAKLVELLYSKLNCSLQTALETLDIDFQEEINRRQAEEDMKLSDIFKPRATSFTTGNGDTTGGRPAGDTNNKQTYDEQYNQVRE